MRTKDEEAQVPRAKAAEEGATLALAPAPVAPRHRADASLRLPPSVSQVNFLQWKRENNHRELQVIRRYHIQDREDYSKYNKVCGMVTKLVSMLKTLAADDPTRIEITDLVLEKLKNMGIVTTKKSLSQLEELSTSAFCRRRLPIVMVRAKMAETVPEAVTFVEQVSPFPPRPHSLKIHPSHPLADHLFDQRCFLLETKPNQRATFAWVRTR